MPPALTLSRPPEQKFAAGASTRGKIAGAPAVTPYGQPQIKTILVPLDFSAASMQALDYAIPFAEQFHSAIHLLYVYERDHEFSPSGDASHLLFEAAEARTQLRRRLADLQHEYALPFQAEDCHVQFGRAPRKACALARKLGADLIVVASRGRTGLPRLLLGSTAERIVRQAPCPVLVARQRRPESVASGTKRRAYPARIRNLFVPVDFSDLSLKAVDYAAALARSFGARLHLFHATFPHDYLVADRQVRDPASIKRVELAAAREQMATIAKMERLTGVPCETDVRSGYPIQEICGAIARTKADLVVTATHGHSGLKHALIGSVAEHIIRYADCPVLVLPRGSHPMK
jgi:nucleotide-binding universal stress UspA family protein